MTLGELAATITAEWHSVGEAVERNGRRMSADFWNTDIDRLILLGLVPFCLLMTLKLAARATEKAAERGRAKRPGWVQRWARQRTTV
jgi:hypothetical protein